LLFFFFFFWSLKDTQYVSQRLKELMTSCENDGKSQALDQKSQVISLTLLCNYRLAYNLANQQLLQIWDGVAASRSTVSRHRHLSDMLV
jgi:hypothetical protein